MKELLHTGIGYSLSLKKKGAIHVQRQTAIAPKKF